MTNIETSLTSQSAVMASEGLLRAAMEALRAGDPIRAAEMADQARHHDQSGRVLIVFAAISHALGRDVDALTILDQAMALAPGIGNFPDAAAAILLKLGRKADGIFNLKLGTHLPSDPFLDEIISDYFGKIKDIFDSFIENRPLTTARLMCEQGLYTAALRHLETYISISGGDEESFALAADCAIHLGSIKEAEVALSALIAMAPSHSQIPYYKLGIEILKGDASRIATAVDGLPSTTLLSEALARYRLLALSPLVDAKTLAQAGEQVSSAIVVNPDVASFDGKEWPKELTLGFICTGIDPALEAILLALRGRLPIKIYLLGSASSPSLQRIRTGFEDVRDVKSIDDATLIEMIRSDQVSVLFDCIGTAFFARLSLWKTRMAPVQILWPQYDSYDDPASYDYRLTGEVDTGQEVARLVSLGMPLRYPLPPAELMGRVAEIRALKVLRDEEAKDVCRLLVPHPGGLLPDTTLDLYMSILDAVPTATMSFIAEASLDDPLVSRILAIADRRGCAERIDLIAPNDFAQSRHEIMMDADLLLDSFPYGNIDLVTECLWISVPILTLTGPRVRERAAAALMRVAGGEALIAESQAEYRDKAVRLLTEPKALTNLKAHLVAEQKTLTLTRYDAVVAALVTRIESLWADWYSKRV